MLSAQNLKLGSLQASSCLINLNKNYRRWDTHVCWFQCPCFAGPVVDDLTRLKFFEKSITRDLLFHSVHDAVLTCQLKAVSVSQAALNHWVTPRYLCSQNCADRDSLPTFNLHILNRAWGFLHLLVYSMGGSGNCLCRNNKWGLGSLQTFQLYSFQVGPEPTGKHLITQGWKHVFCCGQC